MNLNEVVEWVRAANNPHNPDGKIKLLLVWKCESGWAVQPIYSTWKKSDLYKEIQLGQYWQLIIFPFPSSSRTTPIALSTTSFPSRLLYPL